MDYANAKKCFSLKELQVRLVPLRKVPNVSKMTICTNESVPNCIPNDDERERIERRNGVETTKRVPTTLQQHANIPKLDAKHLTQHYNMCMKMFVENKINSNNVWNLQIIDYIKAILQNNTSSTNTFQVATATLEVSTKVYGVRVDDIHCEGLKLAATMGRYATTKKNESDATDDMNESAETKCDENKEEVLKRKSIKRKTKTTTIVNNIESLLAPIVVTCMLPDIYQISSSNSCAVQTSENMFTYQSFLSHGGNSLALHSADTEFLPSGKTDIAATSDKLVSNVFMMDIVTSELCPAFKNFVIDKWNSDLENLCIEATKEPELDAAVFTSNGEPLPELDGSVGDIFSDSDEGCSGLDFGANLDVSTLKLHGDIAHTVDFRPRDDNDNGNAYLHNSSVTEKQTEMSGLLGGPSHWKVKYINRRRIARFSGSNGEASTRKRRSKRIKLEVESLNFEFKESDIDLDQMDFEDHVLKSENQDVDRYVDPGVLDVKPADIFCSLLNTERQILKNEISPIRETADRIKHEQQEDDCANTDYNDAYDCDETYDTGFCSQLTTNSRLSGDENVNETVAKEVEQQGIADNLEEAPFLVTEASVQYATHAKRVNMKKLNSYTWNAIIAKCRRDDNEPTLQKCLFSEVYDDLKKEMPKKMVGDLTVPLAMVSLLHLANENDLQLEGVDLKDVEIFKTSSGVKRRK